jgi:aarF domain-containing kinase
LVNDANADRLARTLCKLRGASLKFGQILSTFEDVVIPAPIKSALERARAEADIMPKTQLFKALVSEYGTDWQSKFKEFESDPFAAASIGQVHKAILHNGTKVAIKIQYPGVAKSIDSDIMNLKRLFEFFKVFPKGVFIDEIVKNIGNELRMECDYKLEGSKQMRFKGNVFLNKSFLRMISFSIFLRCFLNTQLN